jgi:hypothetical protein
MQLQRRCDAFTHQVRFPQRSSLFQISRPVGDEGKGFGDGLRKKGVHHESLAIAGDGIGSLWTTHGVGFEQLVGRAQLQAGPVLLNVNRYDLLVRRVEEKFFAILSPEWSKTTGSR